MDYAINHMLGFIDNNLFIYYRTFQMAGRAMGSVNSYTGYVM